MITRNKLKNITSILVSVICFIALPCCNTNKTAAKQDGIVNYQNYTKATIEKTELDGCTYTIVLEDGKRLEPVNLTDEFKVDKLPVWIQYKHHDGFSICMMGEMVNITAIAKR